MPGSQPDTTDRSDRVVTIERAVIGALLAALGAGAVAHFTDDDHGWQLERGAIIGSIDVNRSAAERNGRLIERATDDIGELRVELARRSSDMAHQTETLVYQLTLTREEMAKHRAGLKASEAANDGQ